MMYLQVDQSQISRLASVVGSTGKELRKQVYIAINAVATKTKSSISKKLSRDLNIKQAIVKRAVRISRKAMQTDLSAEVEVKKDKRFNLTSFGGTQQTAEGVAYKVLRGGATRLARSAFFIRRFGDRTFKRDGQERGPISQLRGPSPWGRFVVGKMMTPVAGETVGELKKQIDRRIRFLKLKQAGTI